MAIQDGNNYGLLYLLILNADELAALLRHGVTPPPLTQTDVTTNYCWFEGGG